MKSSRELRIREKEYQTEKETAIQLTEANAEKEKENNII
jgi:hypothetical protein